MPEEIRSWKRFERGHSRRMFELIGEFVPGTWALKTEKKSLIVVCGFECWKLGNPIIIRRKRLIRDTDKKVESLENNLNTCRFVIIFTSHKERKKEKYTVNEHGKL